MSAQSKCPGCGKTFYGLDRIDRCFCGWHRDPEPPAHPALRLVPPPEGPR